MTLTEFLLARIAEDEGAARAATPGRWMVIDMDDGRPADEKINEDGWWWVWAEDLLPYYGGVMDPDSHAANCTREPETCCRVVVGQAAITDGSTGRKELADAAHIARHDPARVLAECEAKRRLIKKASSRGVVAVGGQIGPWDNGVLRDLALPYADHPDYREEWAA